MNKSQYSTFIKQKARELGFDACGISRARRLTEQEELLEKWIAQGRHGEMAYMANHFDKRLDPRLLVPDAKSVISLSYNYYQTEVTLKPGQPRMSIYAYGKDYHLVVKNRLQQLLQAIRQAIGDVNGRCFVDSGPVMERAWAANSGIGWIGKNSLLLSKAKGSYFFLAELILDLEIEPDHLLQKDYCGKCNKCIDACPTQAIYEPYQVDGSKCISYFTIELKSAQIPTEYQGKFGNWIFGCDVCQQVCPINARSKMHKEESFQPNPAVSKLNYADWLEITEDVFDTIFRESPLKRAGYSHLRRNIQFIMGESKYEH